ncbi:hypothetical protein [Rufibacter aurantiacus]|uniref:hypothetical protein n=1 Tax=Rufibacter aurantiacus TaxID=2817374 RepID=UPI001B316D9B|nr:hypothetical protein [Rufibacter aurantiacus]
MTIDLYCHLVLESSTILTAYTLKTFFLNFLKKLLLVVSVSLFLLFLFGKEMGKALSVHFSEMNDRRERGSLTSMDKLQCKALYNSMIYLGWLFYPEAAEVLHHYLYGKGADLYLEPNYMRSSPVVQLALSGMKTGDLKTVAFRQNKDWRLSYAVNGFTLKKKQNNVLLSQKIIFSKDRKIVTDLNFYLFKVRVPDGLIHVLEPSPFVVYCHWQL